MKIIEIVLCCVASILTILLLDKSIEDGNITVSLASATTLILMLSLIVSLVKEQDY